MATYQILYWRNLPIRVKAKDWVGEVEQEMPLYFKDAQLAAAAQLGIDAYGINSEGLQWSDPERTPGRADDVAEIIAERLAEQLPHSVDELARLATRAAELV